MAIVLDESHKIKNPVSKITNAVLSLRTSAKKRIIITGTPVANKPEDLWSQFQFLDGGILLGNDFSEFKRIYSINLRKDNSYDQEQKLENLRNIIANNSIRRLKKDVLELPEKVFVNEYVQIKGEQKRIYNQIRDELYIEITNMNGQRVIDESDEILKKLLRLAQIASNPFLIDKSYIETPCKFPVLDTLVKKIINNDEKLIIWSSFVENIKILYNRFKKYGSLLLLGNIPIEKRNVIVKSFKNNNENRILVANPATAREGLTLTVANNSIYLDRNFNLVDYLQSQDRIHRIGQTKECKIYKIIAENTIDEYVDDIINKKQKIAEFIQGDTSNIENEPYLTKEEILNILGGING
jgi:SNF2 family DNA or RNA helicase